MRIGRVGIIRHYRRSIDEDLASLQAGQKPARSIDEDLASLEEQPKPAAKPKAPDLTKINFLSGKVKTPSVRGNAQRALVMGQGIPFGERIEAGLGALGDKTYEQSLKDLRAFTGELPEGERTAGKLLGGGALGAFGPLARLSPTAAGAVIGGADQLGNADPMSLGARAGRTAAGTAGGALVGRYLEKGVNLAKALLPRAFGGVVAPEVNYLEREAARAASASKMFGAGMAEGHANEVTPAIQKYLAEPRVAARVADLQKLDQFKNVSPESPEMLDALSKSFSDEAMQIRKGLSQADPSKPNTGRFRLQDIQNQKKGLFEAMRTPGRTPDVVKPPITFDIGTTEASVPGTRVQGEPNLFGLPTHTDVPEVNIGPSEHFLDRAPQGEIMPGTNPSLAGRAPGEKPTSLRVQTVPEEVIPGHDVEAFMPSYPAASEDFARRSGEMRALLRGTQVSQLAAKNPSATARQIQTGTSPRTFAAKMQTRPAGEMQAAREGVFGNIGETGYFSKEGRKTLGTSSKLLRFLDPDSPELRLIRQALGLGGAETSP